MRALAVVVLALVAAVAGCAISSDTAAVTSGAAAPAGEPAAVPAGAPAAPAAEASSALAFSGSKAGESARDSGVWWVQNHGVVDPAADPRARAAQRVFDRLAPSAGERSRRARLLVVAAKGEPFAVALPDGSIVLTRGALDLCYGADGLGDLRLAFVLGHELAHLASDDFWHGAAFAAASGELRALVRPVPRDAQLAELHADQQGAINMAMAGYSVGNLLRSDPEFFARWVAQPGLGEAYEDATHPEPAKRARFLENQLDKVVDALDFFDFGVRLAQLGRYDDAVLLLGRFGEKFPGREVLSNLGYAHYQLAVKQLASCDGVLVARFRLPVAVDDETLASRARLRGGQSACLESEPVLRRLSEARDYLERASKMDSSYLPARRNLAALELVAGRSAPALAIADEMLKIAPGDAGALVAKGVGLYLFGDDSRVETVDAALAVLAEAEADPRRAADAVFNRAVILGERGRTGASRVAWERFLELEKDGAYADLARERLRQPPRRAAAAPPAPPSPIPLGVVGPKTGAALEAMESRAFVIGELRVRFYRGGGLRALQLDNAIEVVEQEYKAPVPSPAAGRRGAPVRVESPRGVLLRYPGHALDIGAEGVRAVLYFVPR